jgi:anti-sigma B factor antagonist
MTAGSSILVGFTPKTVWVQVQGKGSFQNSPGLKEFAREMIQRGHRDFSIDLACCPTMDSTFMGTLAGVALRLRDLGTGELRIVNPNLRNAELLTGLGLDQVLVLDREPTKVPCATTADPMAALQGPDKRTVTQTMLGAHEALCDADTKNRAKFKDVLEYLKDDLHRQDVVAAAK